MELYLWIHIDLEIPDWWNLVRHFTSPCPDCEILLSLHPKSPQTSRQWWNCLDVSECPIQSLMMVCPAVPSAGTLLLLCLKLTSSLEEQQCKWLHELLQSPFPICATQLHLGQIGRSAPRGRESAKPRQQNLGIWIRALLWKEALDF